MQLSEFRKYSLYGHIGLWLIFFMIYFMEEFEYSSFSVSLLYAFSFTATMAALAYIHYFLVWPIFRKSRGLYFLTAFSLVALFSWLSYIIDYNFPFDYEVEFLFWWDFLYNFFLFTLVLGVSSLYYFVEKWFENIHRENSLKNEKLQAELNFLKSQINPHFLFNTLNNVYSYVQTGNPKSGPMLERLSSILRFMVYECSEDSVALSKELEAVEDLLEIYKMKNSEQRNIKLEISGVKGFHLIAPLIIVNLVENACKHSDAISNPNGFLQVNIRVDEQASCQLEIANSFKDKKVSDPKYQGVGLENIRKRLQLQYDDNYTLEEKKEANNYLLKLSIPLERKH